MFRYTNIVIIDKSSLVAKLFNLTLLPSFWQEQTRYRLSDKKIILKFLNVLQIQYLNILNINFLCDALKNILARCPYFWKTTVSDQSFFVLFFVLFFLFTNIVSSKFSKFALIYKV